MSRRITTATAVLTAFLLAGCAAGDTDDGPGAGAPASPSAAPTAAPSAAPSPSVPAVRTIEVGYAGGEVTGTDGREDVSLGEEVVIRVTSDVAEEIHVHGYDIEQQIPAGGTIEIPLTATIPGGVEVELHDSGKLLFQLRAA